MSYRIMNQGPRSHMVDSRDVLEGGIKISDPKQTASGVIAGVTAIIPGKSIVKVTDRLGRRLEKYSEIVIVEKTSEKDPVFTEDNKTAGAPPVVDESILTTLKAQEDLIRSMQAKMEEQQKTFDEQMLNMQKSVEDSNTKLDEATKQLEDLTKP